MELITIKKFRKNASNLSSLRGVAIPKCFEKLVRDEDGDAYLDSFSFSKEGLNGILSLLKIPGNFINVIEDEKLLLNLINYMNGKYDIPSLFSFVSAGESEGIEQIVGVKRFGVDVINPDEVLSAIGSDYPELMIERASCDLNKQIINFAFPEDSKDDEVFHEVAPGDVVTSGVKLVYSPIMKSFPESTPLLYRLVCSNGLTSALNVDQTRKMISGNDGSWPKTIAHNIKMSLDKCDEMVTHFKELKDTKVTNPVGTLTSIATSLRIPSKLTVDMVEMVSNRNVENMYDLVNVFTEHANDPSIGINSGFFLQRMGGLLVDQHRKFCNRCGSVLKS